MISDSYIEFRKFTRTAMMLYMADMIGNDRCPAMNIQSLTPSETLH